MEPTSKLFDFSIFDCITTYFDWKDLLVVQTVNAEWLYIFRKIEMQYYSSKENSSYFENKYVKLIETEKKTVKGVSDEVLIKRKLIEEICKKIGITKNILIRSSPMNFLRKEGIVLNRVEGKNRFIKLLMKNEEELFSKIKKSDKSIHIDDVIDEPDYDEIFYQCKDESDSEKEFYKIEILDKSVEKKEISNESFKEIFEEKTKLSLPLCLCLFTQCINFEITGANIGFFIPDEVGKMKNLFCLDLSNNNLEGEIPSSLSELKVLHNLNLSKNKLIGSIPQEIGNLSFLRKINLSSNQLTGKIPEKFGNLSNLLELDLSSNYLSGGIPSSLGKLYELYYLDLSNNNLSGKLPNSFFELESLVFLILRENKVEKLSGLEKILPKIFQYE